MKRCSFFLILLLTAAAASHAGAGMSAAGADAPKIIVLEFHGLKRDIIQNNLDRLPNFRELIQGPSNRQPYVHLSKVFTTIPAASVPACTAMYTGRYPQQTGVVSTIWFDRRTTKVYTMISYLQQRINRTLEQNNVKTIFDYVKAAGKQSLSAMLMIDKGADISIKSGMFFWGNASTVGLFKRGHWFPDPWYMDHKTISGFLTGHVFAYSKSLSGLLDKQGRIPDLMVVQLLGTDIFSHFPDAALVEQNASMEEIQAHYAQHVLDPEIGRIIRFLKKKNCFGRTIFFLVSQQGAIKIEKHIPDNIVSKILGTHYRLPDMQTPNRSAEAVVMLGACTKEIYLRNRCTGSWLDPPRLLQDVKPAVDLLSQNATIRDSLNTMVVRQYPGERREGVTETKPWWGFDWQNYCKGPRRDTDFVNALQPLEETFKRFELEKYLVQGLTHQYTRATAPDIKLINQKGIYFERNEKKYGHHGSYYPEDTIVSFWIAGPGMTAIVPQRHSIDRETSTLDLVPMVASLLKIEIPDDLAGKNPLAGLLENHP